MKPNPPARLSVLLAREAPVAVIFRRGPSKVVRLIRWQTDTDQFEPGQWLFGVLYPDRCDLSPDGKYLLYFAAKWHLDIGSFTAISRPPFLTALALWRKGDAWGGGWFEGNRTIVLSPGHEPPTPAPPRRFCVRAPQADEYRERSCDDPVLPGGGWARVQPGGGWARIQSMRTRWRGRLHGHETVAPTIWRRGLPDTTRALELHSRLRGFHEFYDYRVIDGAGAELLCLPRAGWADVDQSGRVVYAGEGRLFAVTFDRAGTPTTTPLADFNDMTPEPILSPEWARSW